MDIDQYGSAKVFNWSHDHLVDVLTKGNNKIVNDPLIAHAFKTINRADFVNDAQQTQAYQDQQLQIDKNEILNQPTVIAQMLQMLYPREGKKYLDIGSGSGFVAALLGVITGEQGKVFSLERNQYIAEFARRNILKYPMLNGIVNIIFKDATQGYAEKAPFDYIHCSAAFDIIPQVIKNQLVVGGRMICPSLNNDLHVIERISPTEFDERVEPGFIFDPIKTGIE